MAIPNGFRNVREIAAPVFALARNDSNYLELNGNCCSLAGSAFQADLSIMVGCGMFHNGKAQARTTGCFGVALVHPIETLEDSVLMFCRDTDTGIADSQFVILNVDMDIAAAGIVFDGIIT